MQHLKQSSKSIDGRSWWFLWANKGIKAIKLDENTWKSLIVTLESYTINTKWDVWIPSIDKHWGIYEATQETKVFWPVASTVQ